MSDEKSLSRRKFLQYTGFITGTAATLGLASAVSTEGQAATAHNRHMAAATQPFSRGRMFFTNTLEFQTLSAAAEQIFPKDNTGPGAIELAVPYFIDNQLAGAYGYNAREYTGGPHFTGAPTQGYQTPLLRREVFKQGLQALNNAAQKGYKKDFPKLSSAEQIQILTDCEAGKLPTQGFTSAYFFGLLKGMVLAGVYSDPIYNGNDNMNGWRLKNYPGAQMSYDWLITSAKFEKVAPMSLSSMQ